MRKLGLNCAMASLIALLTAADFAVPAARAAEESEATAGEPEGGEGAQGEGQGAGGGEGGSGQRGRSSRRQRVEMKMFRAKVAGKNVFLTYGQSAVTGPDYKQLETIKTGEVVRSTTFAAPKMKSEAGYKFGEVAVPTGNASPSYPGVYTLWLKKTDAGWSLVFNDEGDIWGTMHNKEFDKAEVPLTYAKAEEEIDKLTIEIKSKDAAGEFTIAWGPHRWSAAFTAE